MIEIEFGLPTGSLGLAANSHANYIKNLLAHWADQHCCSIETKISVHDFRRWLVVSLSNDDFEILKNTWNHRTFMHWQIIENADK